LLRKRIIFIRISSQQELIAGGFKERQEIGTKTKTDKIYKKYKNKMQRKIFVV
jgi:hypothetical protein